MISRINFVVLLITLLVILNNSGDVEMLQDKTDSTETDDYFVGGPADGGMEQEELFFQFRMKNFQAKILTRTEVLLKWTIHPSVNRLDMDRTLDISTVYPERTELIDGRIITMSKDICHKHSDSKGECNYTVSVESCSNYLFRLGDGHLDTVSTVSIEPSSIREEFDKNGSLILSWNITCDSEFMSPVTVTLTQSRGTDLKTSLPTSVKLSATCKNRKCRTKSTELLVSPCSNYSLQIDGADDLRIIESPPKITDLQAEKIPSDNRYLLRWSIFPANCLFSPRFVVESVQDSLKTPQYSRLVLNSPADQYCKNGTCEYRFETEPCVTYKLKPSGSSIQPIELFGPSISKIFKEYTGDLNKPVRLNWKMCDNARNEGNNIIISPVDDMRQRIKYLTSIQATCDQRSRQCSSNVTNDQNILDPCHKYKLEINGSKETLNFETPPLPSISISQLTSTFSINQTLTISLEFGFQRSCESWNVSIELQILDLSRDVLLIACRNNSENIINDSPSRYCTASIPIKQSAFICLSKHRIKTRPNYSRSDLTSKVYRGNWLEETVIATKPSEWNDGEALTELAVESDVHKESVIVDWKSPICLNGSIEYSTNLGIVSRSQKYYVTIPFSCSRLNEDGGNISKKRKVFIDNGQITCTDGNQLQDQGESFELWPCTLYSFTLTPLVLESEEELRNSSVTNTSMTAFVPLDVNNISVNIGGTVSHLSGYEWQFNLYFLNKETNPCSRHISSAMLQTSYGRQFNQTIRCNQGVACNGVVKLNHFNLCRPLPVTIGFQYSHSEVKGYISWFNKTLPPIVANQTSEKPFNSLKIHDANRHRFEIQWQDHVCLANGSVSLWIMEIRQSNGTILKTFNVPQTCSNRGKSKYHRVFLEENKLVCEENSTLYNLRLVPCTEYLLSVTPMVKGTNATQIEYSQSANFTTPFNSSSIENLETANVTARTFELHWTIPWQCSNTTEMKLEVNGKEYSSLSFGALSQPYTQCDKVKCHVTWSNPKELQLEPCTNYNIRVGPYNNVTIITLPGDNGGLAISPENVSVLTKISNDSYLDIAFTVKELDQRCSARLVAVDFNVSDTEPPIKKHLLCNSDEKTASAKVCSERIPIIWIDKCKTYNFIFRPLYENGLFSDVVRTTSMKLNPLLSEEEKKEKYLPPQVEIYGQQSIRLYWNDPVCLMANNISSWEVRINSSTQSHSIQLPSECSSGFHLPVTNKSKSFKHSLQLDNGRIAWCNQPKSDMESLYSSDGDMILTPCSRHLVNVIPVAVVSKSVPLENFVETTYFKTSIDKINPTISKTTFNTFELMWSFPVQCLPVIPMDQTTSVNINGTTLDTSFTFSNLSSPRCNETTCIMNWISPRLLSACTWYWVSVNSVYQEIFTVPNYLDHLTCAANEKSDTEISRQEFSTDSNVAEKKLTTLVGSIIIISLGFLGFVLIFITIGFCFRIFSEKITIRETGNYDVGKKNSQNLKSSEAARNYVTQLKRKDFT